jgi:uncharacterized protein (DUF486 family)
MVSSAYNQLVSLLANYSKILPISTFPYIPFIIASVSQSMAWVAGPIYLKSLSLIPRIFFLLLFAVGEYTFMAPAMNASVEVLHMTEPYLVVMYQALTLCVFMFMNVFIFKNPFQLKYVVSSFFLIIAVYIASVY